MLHAPSIFVQSNDLYGYLEAEKSVKVKLQIWRIIISTLCLNGSYVWQKA